MFYNPGRTSEPDAKNTYHTQNETLSVTSETGLQLFDPHKAPSTGSVKNPPALNRNNIIGLQRTIGNQAVTRLIAQQKAAQNNHPANDRQESLGFSNQNPQNASVQRVIIMDDGEEATEVDLDPNAPEWRRLSEYETGFLWGINEEPEEYNVYQAIAEARYRARQEQQVHQEHMRSLSKKKPKVIKKAKKVESKAKRKRVDSSSEEENEVEVEEKEEKKVNTTTPPKKQQKTANKVSPSNSPKIVITQFGGQRGSSAGDAAVIGLPGSRRLHKIDFGTGKQSENAHNAVKGKLANIQDIDSEDSEWESGDDTDTTVPKPKSGKGVPKFSATITHSHADHAGLKAKRKEYYQPFSSFNMGESQPEMPENMNTPINKMGKKKPTMFSYKQKAKVKGRRLSVKGQAILPDHEADETDANKMSLGGLIKVDAIKEKVDERIFTFLTLGDMDPQTASKRVQEAHKADGGQPVDLIKVAHHGSENNIGSIPAEAIGPQTRVIVSGYTMTDTKKLANFISENNLAPGKSGEPRVFFLFSETKFVREFQGIGAAFRNLEALGIKILKDYTIKISQDGQVEHVEVPH